MGRGGGCVPGKLSVKRRSKGVNPSAAGTEEEALVGGEEVREVSLRELSVSEPPAADATPVAPAALAAPASVASTGEEAPALADAAEPASDAADESAAPAAPKVPARKLKIFIVYYSMYGHVAAMAKKVKEGVDSIEGVEGCLYQVPETLAKNVLELMQAPEKDSSVPIVSAGDLPAADAIIFGFPTRYGAMAAQMKAFFDTTGQLWRGQLLAGKPAGFFVSTGTQGGGQETTSWTAITQLAHHGMLFVPIGYTFGAGMFKLDEVRGGSPYGAGTYAGDGTRKPTETELAMASHQGKYTAGFVKRIMGSEL